MKIRLYMLKHIFISLLLGFCIYIFMREKTYLHRFFSVPFESIFCKSRFFGDTFIRYYLPDFFWEYSLCFTLYFFFPPISKKVSLFPALFSFLFGVIYETAQFFDFLPGTGDAVDVLLYLLAAVAVYGIISIYTKLSKGANQ